MTNASDKLNFKDWTKMREFRVAKEKAKKEIMEKIQKEIVSGKEPSDMTKAYLVDQLRLLWTKEVEGKAVTKELLFHAIAKSWISLSGHLWICTGTFCAVLLHHTPTVWKSMQLLKDYLQNPILEPGHRNLLLELELPAAGIDEFLNWLKTIAKVKANDSV